MKIELLKLAIQYSDNRKKYDKELHLYESRQADKIFGNDGKWVPRHSGTYRISGSLGGGGKGSNVIVDSIAVKAGDKIIFKLDKSGKMKAEVKCVSKF